MSSTPPPSAGEVIVHVCGRTDVGRTREHNEDAFIIADFSSRDAAAPTPIPIVEQQRYALGARGAMFMVADGMGGAAAGEVASAMAVEIVLGRMRIEWLGEPSVSAEAFMRSIKRATRSANEQIHTYATRHSEYRGMGTTATIAGVLGDTLYLAQVGDSRAYLVRDGVARQITKDQSLMQKLIEAGELTEEEAAHSERRNIILQAIGPEATIKVDLTHQPIRRGDTLVLCSDGLSGQMSAQDIAAIVTSGRALRDVCDALIDRANAAGGPDNITVIVAQFDGSGLQPPVHADEVGHRVFALPETGQTPVAAMDVTQPMPAVRNMPRMKTPRSVEIVEAPPEVEAATPPASAAETATVSPARRRVGRLVAGALLVLLAAAVAWLVLRLTGITAPSAPATTVSHGATPASAPAP